MVKDEFAYTKFIHDITVEVVENGQFTDKSLTKIIRKHIHANTSILDKKRMLEEVKKLRELLGMADNDEDEINDISMRSIKKPSLARNDSITELESWTDHYKHLSSIQNNTEEKEKASTTTISSSVADFEDSDSSRETTIKEVMQKGGSESSEEVSGGDEEVSEYEIIESGTSVDEDIF